MITRLLASYCCFILLLLPTMGWALNEPGEAPAAQAVPVIAAPVQPAPAQTAPVPPKPLQSAPAQAESAKPAPVADIPGKTLTHPAPTTLTKPAPAPNTLVKPAPAPSTLAKPAPAPHTLAKPVPALPLHAKSAPSPSLPMQPAPAPASKAPSGATASQIIDIEVFVREGCQPCDKANEFLAKLQNLQPHLKIIIRDVRKEPAALELLKRVAQNQGEEPIDYPAFVVGGQLIIGFSEEAGSAQQILDALAISHPSSQKAIDDAEACETGSEPSCGLIPPAPVTKPEAVTITLFGYNMPLVQIGLPLFTVAMGLLDGLNYGSTWVLLLMISLLVPMKNRPVMLAIAGTFIAVQGLIYLVFMSAWLNIFIYTGTSRISEIVIAGIALLVGAIYFKNYLHFGHSISISSQEISKPGIYTRIRKIVQAENLIAALLGTTVLAILVQVAEFSYKSIFPAMYTRVLTLQHMDSISNYGYLLLYDFAYMLDDIIVLAIGVITLSQNRSQDETAGSMLKLISSLMMAGLGAYLLLTRHLFF